MTLVGTYRSRIRELRVHVKGEREARLKETNVDIYKYKAFINEVRCVSMAPFIYDMKNEGVKYSASWGRTALLSRLWTAPRFV